MRVKEESEKAALRCSIQKTKMTASVPITSWQTDGEKVEIVPDFLFLGSKITADSGCSHEIKRHLLLGRKAVTNWDSILKKSRDMPTKVHIVKNYGFSSNHVGMWELDCKESWAPKDWCFQIVVLEETLRVPWTAKRSNQSILKLNPEYALEGHYIDTEPPRKPLVTSLSLIFLCDSFMYEIKIVFLFGLMWVLLLGQPKSLQRKKGKFFCPFNYMGGCFILLLRDFWLISH